MLISWNERSNTKLGIIEISRLRVPTQTGETALNLSFLGSIVFDFVWLSLLNCRVVGEDRFFPKLGFQKVFSVGRRNITAIFLHFQNFYASI